jgi:hypothetical protein
MRKEACSFLKKRTKKLFPTGTDACRKLGAQTDKSLFASFSSEKEDPFLLRC